MTLSPLVGISNGQFVSKRVDVTYCEVSRDNSNGKANKIFHTFQCIMIDFSNIVSIN